MAPIGEALVNVTQAAVDRHITGADGQRTALRFGDKQYSFHDLAALTNRAGNMLKQLGVAVGRSVVIAVPPSPAYAASLLGAMKIGALPVLFAGAIDRAALAKVLADVKPALLVIHQDHLRALEPRSIADDAVVVVGQEPGRHKSFLALVREAPSSLSGAPAAPALCIHDGASPRTLSTAELTAALQQQSGAPAGGKAVDLLRTLSAGGTVVLA
jgi:acyl-coenzyme A synthetase/AMP-(fatty) acid ligase